MAKISRALQKIFGLTASPGQIGVYGSLAAGSPAYSTNPETIQSLTNYSAGWYAGVVGENSPAIQDMNALFYLLSYQLSYLFQAGVAEWNAATTYYIGSIVQDGAGGLYVSLIDNNLNNAVTDISKWGAKAAQIAVSTKNANYTLTAADDFIRANGAITITLPAVAAAQVGKQYIVKNVSSSSTVTLAANGSELIDGANTLALLSAPVHQAISVINNGTSWDIV